MSAIVESIATSVATLLSAITTSNGYPVTVGSVVRPKQLGDVVSVDDLTITLAQRGRNRADVGSDESHAGFAVWRQDFEAICVRRASDAASTAADSMLNAMAASVEQALMANAQLIGTSVEGWVLDTEVVSVEPIDPTDGAYVGARVLFGVTYRHPIAVPFEQAAIVPSSIAVDGANVEIVCSSSIVPDGVRNAAHWLLKYAVADDMAPTSVTVIDGVVTLVNPLHDPAPPFFAEIPTGVEYLGGLPVLRNATGATLAVFDLAIPYP